MTNNLQAQRSSVLRQLLTALFAALFLFAMSVPSVALADTTDQTDETVAEPETVAMPEDAEEATELESPEDEQQAVVADQLSGKKAQAAVKMDAEGGEGGEGGSGDEGGADEGSDDQVAPQDSEPVSIANATVKLEKKTYVYDKTKHKPDTTVVLDGKTLKRGTDYKVKYSKNKVVGTATVTVTGTGDYTDKAKATFRILPMATAFREVITRTTTKMRVRWNAYEKQATGYELQYGKTKKLATKGETVKFAKATLDEGVVKGLKPKLTYYARVRVYTKVDDELYYSKWSKIASVKPFIKSRQAKAVPVIAYHRICSDKAKRRIYGTGLAISETNFRKQMRWLGEHGYHGVSMAEFIDWYLYGAYLPKKSILITIDDGFYETYWVARPILKRYGQKATNFVIGNRTPSKTVAYNPNSRRNHYVGKDVIKEANSSLDCLKYESHTYGMHNKASRERPYLQVWSQAKINKDFDTMDDTYGFSSLAYPFGYGNSKAYKACKRSKIMKIAFTYKTNTPARRSSPKYRLPRYKVKGNKSWTSIMPLVGTYK